MGQRVEGRHHGCVQVVPAVIVQQRPLFAEAAFFLEFKTSIAPIFWWISPLSRFWQVFDDCRDKAGESPGKVFQPFELRGEGGREFLLPPSFYKLLPEMTRTGQWSKLC
jgi:hypothetical protein